jgi:hypothetical protein
MRLNAGEMKRSENERNSVMDSDEIYLDMHDLKDLGLFEPQKALEHLNRRLLKKRLIKAGQCPHDPEDVMARPRAGVEISDPSFRHMVLEHICSACNSVVVPAAFRKKVG